VVKKVLMVEMAQMEKSGHDLSTNGTIRNYVSNCPEKISGGHSLTSR